MHQSRVTGIVLCSFFGVICVIVLAAFVASGRPFSPDYIPPLVIIALMVIFIVGILRDRKPPKLVEEQYSKLMGKAFTARGQSRLRRRLIRAAEFFSLKKYADSLRLLQKLELKCSRDSDYAAVYAFMGLNYNRLKLHKDSARFYRNSLAYIPEQATVLNNLCTAYFGTGQFEEAAEYGKKAIALNSMDPCAQYNTAFALVYAGHYVEALPYALRARELNERVYQPLFALALIHHWLGNRLESQLCRKAAISKGAKQATIDRALERVTKHLSSVGADIPPQNLET